MSGTAEKKEYLAICRGAWNEDMTPQDIEKAFADFYEWFDRMIAEGKMRGGQRLEDEGRVVSAGKTATDGPFLEAKELIGGFWYVLADSLDEAAEIIQGDPCLEHGLIVEVRPIIRE